MKIKGTNIGSSIVPLTDNDTYPTHQAVYGKGGYRSVLTIADMNSIPNDRLEIGMLVFVLEDGVTYKLESINPVSYSKLFNGDMTDVSSKYKLVNVNGSDISNVIFTLNNGDKIVSSFAHTHPEYLLIDDPRVANWDTAFSWGNHAEAGYALLNGANKFTNDNDFRSGLLTAGTLRQINAYNTYADVGYGVFSYSDFTTTNKGYGWHFSAKQNGNDYSDANIYVYGYFGDTSLAYHEVYHSGNSNKNTKDWVADNLSANNTIINGTLTIPSGAHSGYVALSDSDGKLIWTDKESFGGDMYKSVYDTNNSGVVDNSEKLSGYKVYAADLTDSFIPIVFKVPATGKFGMEIGGYIDFHETAADGKDYDSRIISLGQDLYFAANNGGINNRKIWHNGDRLLTGPHDSDGSVYSTVNVIYGTADTPPANTYPEGTIYFQYV